MFCPSFVSNFHHDCSSQLFVTIVCHCHQCFQVWLQCTHLCHLYYSLMVLLGQWFFLSLHSLAWFLCNTHWLRPDRRLLLLRLAKTVGARQDKTPKTPTTSSNAPTTLSTMDRLGCNLMLKYSLGNPSCSSSLLKLSTWDLAAVGWPLGQDRRVPGHFYLVNFTSSDFIWAWSEQANLIWARYF